MAPPSPRPLTPSGFSGTFRVQVRDLDRRNLACRRHAVVQQRPTQEIAMRVVRQLLPQRPADALRHAAHDLAIHDQRIDQRPRVADHGVVEDRQLERLPIELDDGDVQPAGERRPRRQEVVRRLEPRLHAVRQRAAPAPQAPPARPASAAASGAPRTCTPPSTSSRSTDAASSTCAASASALSRTRTAASNAELPATTALRDAYVPTP